MMAIEWHESNMHINELWQSAVCSPKQDIPEEASKSAKYYYKLHENEENWAKKNGRHPKCVYVHLSFEIFVIGVEPQ